MCASRFIGPREWGAEEWPEDVSRNGVRRLIRQNLGMKVGCALNRKDKCWRRGSVGGDEVRIRLN